MRQRRPTLRQMAATLALYVPKLIPEHLRDKNAKVILAALDFHHDPIPFADGGTCEPQNLTPMLREEHKRITAKVTVPTIAKGKRLRKREDEHKLVMRRKGSGGPEFSNLTDEELLALKLTSDGEHKLIREHDGKLSWTKLDDSTIKMLGLEKVELGKSTWTGQRKMKGRGFQGHRKFDGTPVWKNKRAKD